MSATAGKPVVKLDIQALAERPKHRNMLIYGESGVGKTTFAASAPRPILWLDSEGGTASIDEAEGIDVAPVSSLEHFRQAVQVIRENPGRWETVVIDSFTEAQVAVMKEIMRAVVKKDPTRDEFTPQFAEWGRLTGVMREIARSFRDLPLNTVITALTREDTDDLTGRTKVRPRLTPALADELPALMDVSGYLYAATARSGEVNAQGAEGEATEEGEEKKPAVVRNLLLKPTGKYGAKLRAPKGSNPPDFVTDPTWEAVSALLG
jgi:hypothetical protein